jgi:hypothetical protein
MIKSVKKTLKRVGLREWCKARFKFDTFKISNMDDTVEKEKNEINICIKSIKRQFTRREKFLSNIENWFKMKNYKR